MHTPPPEMTYGFLIQLVFCKKCGLLVLVTPFLSGAPPPKKNPGSAPVQALKATIYSNKVNMGCFSFNQQSALALSWL